MTDKKSITDKRIVSLRLIAAIGLSILSIGLICIGASRLLYPFDTGIYEALIWQPSKLLMSGENPYAYATREPYVMAPYGVVYYFLIGIGVKLFGLQLWWGRLISIVATVVCLWTIGRIVFDLTGKVHIARIAQMAFLASYPLQIWFAVQRSDLIALALAFTGLNLVLMKDSKGDNLKLLLSVICFVLAYFTKQTALLPVFFAALSYWLRGKRMSSVLLISLTITSCLIIAFIINLTSDGGYVWQHFTHAGRLPFSFAQSLTLLIIILKLPSTVIFCVAIFFAVYQNHKLLFASVSRLFQETSVWKSTKGLIIFYLLVAMFFAFLTTGRTGASSAYYLETFLVASIVFALICDWWERRGKENVAIAFTVLLILSGSLFLFPVARGEYFRWHSLPYYREMVESVNRLTPPDSLCISVYPELITAAGRDFHFDDWGEYNEGWSPELKELFNKAISSKRYAAIILHSDNLKLEGYHPVKMKTPPPEKFYKAFLYVRDAKP